MKVRELYEILNDISPFNLQASWDNSGLNIGEWECEIERIYLALELTEEMVLGIPSDLGRDECGVALDSKGDSSASLANDDTSIIFSNTGVMLSGRETSLYSKANLESKKIQNQDCKDSSHSFRMTDLSHAENEIKTSLKNLDSKDYSASLANDGINQKNSVNKKNIESKDTPKTQNNINTPKKTTLFITHHPLIFAPLKTLHTHLYPSNIIRACIKRDISLIAMHTNFDLTHLNNAFVKKLDLESLNLQYSHTQDFSIIYHANNILLENLVTYIALRMGLKHIRYSKATDNIQNIYITSGSNASSYNIAKRGDCIITGDIKYHDAMIAKSNGISFIEVGHFESECIFGSVLQEILQKLDIHAIIADSHNPFIIRSFYE